MSEYHDRIQKLMEGANRLQASVRNFAQANGVIGGPGTAPMSGPMPEPVASFDNHAMNDAASNVAAQDIAASFSDVRADVESVNDIVNGINLDDLMNGVDINMDL